jgi:hypothetical protein
MGAVKNTFFDEINAETAELALGLLPEIVAAYEDFRATLFGATTSQHEAARERLRNAISAARTILRRDQMDTQRT